MSSATAGAEDLVEKEARRLEVMKRRQERELAQLVAYEMARKEMQDKAEAKVGVAQRERGQPLEQMRMAASGDMLAAEWRVLARRNICGDVNTRQGTSSACFMPLKRNLIKLPPVQVREQERRAEEARLAKQAADEEWRRQQHERELQRKLEEEAREKEVKVSC